MCHPRFQAGYFKANYGIHAGFERVIAPYGFIYMFQETDDTYQPDFVEEAETGFRWFSGYKKSFNSKFKIQIDGYFSLLSNPLLMQSDNITENIQIQTPIIGETQKKTGILFDITYTPWKLSKFNLQYSWNRSQIAWPGNVTGSRVSLQPASRYPAYEFTEYTTDVDADYSCPHAIHFSNESRLPFLWNLQLQFAYGYYSGRPYTPLQQNSSGDYSFGLVNSETGPAWQRFDFELSRMFILHRNIAIHAGLRIVNVLDSWQDPSINPLTGSVMYEPFSQSSSLPRTVSISCNLVF